MSARVAKGKSVKRTFEERFARFSLYEFPGDGVYFSRKDRFIPASNGRFLDKLMHEIPGNGKSSIHFGNIMNHAIRTALRLMFFISLLTP